MYESGCMHCGSFCGCCGVIFMGVLIRYVVFWGGIFFDSLLDWLLGCGLVMQVCSMHWLRVFMIPWSLFCASSYCGVNGSLLYCSCEIRYC